MERPVRWCSLFLPSLSFPCHGSDTLEERDLPIFLSFPVSLHSQLPLQWDPYNKVTRGRQAWSWAIFLVNLGSTANMMVHVWLFRGRDTLNSCSNQCDLNCSDGNCVLYQKCFSFSFTESKRKTEAPPFSSSQYQRICIATVLLSFWNCWGKRRRMSRGLLPVGFLP